MTSPTPRQQAGYLRRLLRRGEVEVADPLSGQAVPTGVEIRNQVIRLVPLIDAARGSSPDEDHWRDLMARLQAVLSRDEAEELIAAVEQEHKRSTRF